MSNVTVRNCVSNSLRVTIYGTSLNMVSLVSTNLLSTERSELKHTNQDTEKTGTAAGID